MSIVTDVVASWAEWFMLLAGFGLGIGAVVLVVSWAWGLLRDLTDDRDYSGHSSVRDNLPSRFDARD